MEEFKKVKNLIDDNVARHDGSRGEGACHENSDTPQNLINSNRFTHLTHFRKHKATQIIRGAAKARFRRTLRAGFADAHTAPYRKFGFTLAEVLITLGVIGIVAAMTIPNLVQSYKKKVVETKLVKFYSTISNAIKLSEVDNGEHSTWEIPYNSVDVDDYYNEYFDKYIRVLRKDYRTDDNKKHIELYFSDGSLADVKVDDGALTWEFFPNANDFNITQGIDRTRRGTSSFPFTFAPQLLSSDSKGKYNNSYGFEPYKFSKCEENTEGQVVCPGLSREELMNDKNYGCNKTAEYGGVYCTLLIYQNNWKIPEDYPFKF